MRSNQLKVHFFMSRRFESFTLIYFLIRSNLSEMKKQLSWFSFLYRFHDIIKFKAFLFMFIWKLNSQRQLVLLLICHYFIRFGEFDLLTCMLIPRPRWCPHMRCSILCKAWWPQSLWPYSSMNWDRRYHKYTSISNKPRT